jgi:outer membrane protein OmpA-like peptidoglycan-associated protein
MRSIFALCALVILAATAVADRSKLVVVTTKEIVLRDPVTFEAGKAVIRPESFAVLDALGATLTADPRIAFVEIQVHTDARGAAAWNLRLSQARAEAIYQYLVDRGIDARRLRAKGYGETRPIDKGHDAKAQARNRRTAFVIRQRVTT